MTPLLAGLTNDDVAWNANPLGLWPTLPSGVTERAYESGEDAIPELIDALADPERFVVAHVLLTQLSGVEYRAVPTWNGLEVELRPDGSTVIDPAQRHDLGRRWRRWSESTPRPKSLPEAE